MYCFTSINYNRRHFVSHDLAIRGGESAFASVQFHIQVLHE